jgi:predicted alpha/beta-hydrolase family hydrolase
MKAQEIRIDVPGALPVSGLVLRPESMRALLVFAHGAGAGMRHASLEAIAAALARRSIGTLRFQFPYMEAGRPRTDPPEVAVAAILAALAAAREREPAALRFVGGHSFGGRMASLAASQHALDVRGLVFCSFPLHTPERPDVKRAAHLPGVPLPMLFLSGERDAMAEKARLEEVVRGLGGRARLHWLATADHGYKILKRTRTNPESVFDEIARVASDFVERHR